MAYVIYKCKTNFHTNAPTPKSLSKSVYLTGSPDFVACGITPNNDYIYSVREKRKGKTMKLLFYEIR